MKAEAGKTQNTSSGLSFKKIDLHIQTPASICFKDKATCTPEKLVDAAIKKGLDAIAITDHNTGSWIDKVKEAAKGKPIVIFPGVEISCNSGKKNIHIVALLDPATGTKDIEVILNVLGILPDKYGNQEAITMQNTIQVIEEIHKHGGIAVLAHVNSSNGVLSDMDGQPRIQTIQCPPLLAVEATDFNDGNKAQKRKRAIDLLDGSNPLFHRKLAVFQASDNQDPDGSGQHSLAGIGSRYSYFKMEQINLEALRHCFIDPEVRIRQEGEVNLSTYPYIRSVRINSGFLDGQEIRFHPGLTSILGAKGAGKSLLIEFLRFALNQEPKNGSIAQDHVSKLGQKLGEFGIVEIVFVDENGKETPIKRTYHDLDDSPYDNTVPFDPAQVFHVLFLSQNEIIAIAEHEEEQLHFIDQFFDFYGFRARIAAIEKELKRLDKIMAEGLRAITEHADLTVKFQTIEKQISQLDEDLKNPIFERYQELEKKEKALSDQKEYLSVFIDNVGRAKDAILARSIPMIPDTLKNDPALLRNTSLITKAQGIIEEYITTIYRNLEEIRQSAATEYSSWHPKYEAGKKEYEAYIQEKGGDYKGIALTRQRLVKQRGDIQRQMDIVGAKKDEVPPTNKKRNELLDALQQEYAQYTAKRKEKCEKFMWDSGGKLKLRILDQSNVDRFKDSLLALKRGSYLKDEEISIITSNINPRDFVLYLLWYEAKKETKYLQKVSDASDIDIKRMKILADFLLTAIPFEDLLALQYEAQPQDRPEILYDIGGKNFEPISHISVGQKCTAMLLMALSDGNMPIIIDQPEDSLDIRSIWDDMCKKLRTGKEKRQFIFTTHNSSLAVASDTDCFIIMEGNALHGEVVHVGAMDHPPVSDEVVKYLEGGPDTYLLKYKKYRKQKET